MQHFFIKNLLFFLAYSVLQYSKGGASMTVSKDSKRIAVTISKEAYDKMVKIATKEGRTISNLASYLINQQLNSK